MKTKAVRLYGKDDLRLEEFELPAIQEDEILARVVSDSICMSSYKATHQGTDHKRVPDNVAEQPVKIRNKTIGILCHGVHSLMLFWGTRSLYSIRGGKQRGTCSNVVLNARIDKAREDGSRF